MHWRFLKTIYIYKVLLLFHKQFLGLTSFFEAVLTDYIQKRTVLLIHKIVVLLSKVRFGLKCDIILL